MPFGLSVLFATHNGALTLPLMLDSLEKLRSPRRPIQILAIDNASTDDTAPILRRAAERLPISTLHCPVPGKVPSLKLAAQHVSGDLVLFTDDDVLPSLHWLVAFEEAADLHPQTFLFGGPITPVELEPVSPWFQASYRHHAELYALSDAPEGDVDAVSHVYGPNFLTRREHLDVLDAIPAGLGPDFTRARAFAMGEDSLIIKSLVDRGARPRYVRKAGVKHLVRAFQTDLDFMLARAERHGRGVALQMLASSRHVTLTRAQILLSNAVALAKARLAARPTAQPPTPDTFDGLWDIHWPLGAIKGALSGRSALRAQL